MAGSITADPAKIHDSALSVENDARSFKAKVDELYSAVDTLAQTFTGTDGQSFVTKIRSHQEVFESLNKRLISSAEGLKNIADDIAKTIKAGVID